ncbi:MAG TPA: formylmethanofuran dehydrogenase subunit E family protein [Candidatus Wallbacteria bacterium]|nr:formylmethanofuran dehydrogenase subunit E family protein [Candidatus Wallbacteria bacterium]
MINISEKIELSYDEFLKEVKKAKKFHGHVCGGIYTGVKLALVAKKIMNYKKFPARDLIVITEIDRCLTDAIMSVTGCRFGRKTLKIKDYGKFGATFCSLATGEAVRIVSCPKSMNKTKKAMENQNIDEHDKEKMGEMIFNVPVREQFIIKEASVCFSEYELPGKPKIIEPCSVCGENIFDGKHVVEKGEIYCRPCLERRSFD